MISIEIKTDDVQLQQRLVQSIKQKYDDEVLNYQYWLEHGSNSYHTVNEYKPLLEALSRIHEELICEPLFYSFQVEYAPHGYLDIKEYEYQILTPRQEKKAQGRLL